MSDDKGLGIVSSAMSLLDLIDKYRDTGFEIPPYQRGYEWGPKSIQRFIDTLYGEFEKEEQEPVFLGPIQISKEENSSASPGIIDGRQRLTTLSLLEAYLIHCKASHKEGDSIASLLRLDEGLSNELQAIHEAEDVEPYPAMDANNPSILRLTRNGKHAAEEDVGREGIYHRNIRYIATILNKAKELKKLDGFLDYVKEKVFFVVIEVQRRDLTSIIKIFDSMNSTGQPLSDDAMFKLRLYAHVRASEENALEPKAIVDKINETYKRVEDYNADPAYKIKVKMSDVLWGFRLYCYAKKGDFVQGEGKNEIKADSFLMPTLAFFERLFGLQDAKITLETFDKYVERHIEFYKKLYGDMGWTDQNEERSEKTFLYALPDYFLFTRYSQFWALPVAYYALKGEDVTIEECLSRYQGVFETCLAWSICNDRTNKRLRTEFLDHVLDFKKEDLTDTCIEFFGKIDSWRTFWKRLQKGMYATSYWLSFLLLAILGMQDEMKVGKTFDEALNLYFHKRDDGRPQLEHIYAKKNWSDVKDEEKRELLNGIGNLVPLEAKVNKGSNKDELPSKKFAAGAFFGKSHIQSVKKLQRLYEESNDGNLDDVDGWIKKIVNVRYDEMRARLSELMPLLAEQKKD